MIHLKLTHAFWFFLIPFYFVITILLTMHLFKTQKALKAGGLGLGTLVIVGAQYYLIMEYTNLFILISFSIVCGIIIMILK